jgi:hypothetical protein
VRESIEIEWTAHVTRTRPPRRRWPWDLLPMLIVVLLPLTSVNVVALTSGDADDPESDARDLLGIDVPLHATPVHAGWTADYGGLTCHGTATTPTVSGATPIGWSSAPSSGRPSHADAHNR